MKKTAFIVRFSFYGSFAFVADTKPHSGQSPCNNAYRGTNGRIDVSNIHNTQTQGYRTFLKSTYLGLMNFFNKTFKIPVTISGFGAYL